MKVRGGEAHDEFLNAISLYEDKCLSRNLTILVVTFEFLMLLAGQAME